MENLHGSFFACPALRKFPIDSRESTESSFGAYKVQRGSFSKEARAAIEDRFNKAASFYGISLPDGADDAPAAPERQLLMFKGASEGVSMPEIESIDELREAAGFLIEKRASVPREDLSEAAKYVLWNAANSDIDLTGPEMRKIAHIAGIGVGKRDEIENEFVKRATVLELDGKDREEFWKFASELKAMPDDEFFTEKNLNRVCRVLDGIDFTMNMQDKHASTLGYPEDVVFADTADDLVKEASDMLYVPSIDTVLSKKALLERENRVKGFFGSYFTENAAKECENTEKMLEKVASLDKYTAEALIGAIND